jgi:hypothetical protein
MALLLVTNKRRWDPLGDAPDVPPADALVDLRTQSNELSVWIVDTQPVPERLLAAIAANRDGLNKIDYVLLDEVDVIHRLGCRIEKTDGGLPDRLVSDELHRDLKLLTARQILDLAEYIFVRRDSMQRYSEGEVRRVLVESLRSGFIDSAALNERMQDHLRRKRLIQ